MAGYAFLVTPSHCRSFMQTFFNEQGRTPLEDGWHRPDIPIEDDNFNNLTYEIGR